MSRQAIGLLLRTLAEMRVPYEDAALLREFVEHRSEAAFNEMIRRHGGVVWSICQYQTHSEKDAEDAFQGTFLVFTQQAHKIRDAAKLGAWLHSVAYKICVRSRHRAKKQRLNEQKFARTEVESPIVTERQYDQAMTAIHEEVARLPKHLQVPFVLCCLQGKGVSEAAQQLGWKLGTFSGRLTRAKDLIRASLQSKGLATIAITALSITTPPTSLIAKTTALAQVGFVVPLTLLKLTQGAFGMSLFTWKTVVVTTVVTCGLGISTGPVWVRTATGQLPRSAGEGRIVVDQNFQFDEQKMSMEQLEKQLMDLEVKKIQKQQQFKKEMDELQKSEELLKGLLQPLHLRDYDRLSDKDRIKLHEKFTDTIHIRASLKKSVQEENSLSKLFDGGEKLKAHSVRPNSDDHYFCIEYVKPTRMEYVAMLSIFKKLGLDFMSEIEADDDFEQSKKYWLFKVNTPTKKD